MSVITWKECYETKIVSLDQEHKQLVEQINLLYEAIRDRRSQDVMQSIIDTLVEYTQKHFAHEEKILEEYNYPELETQRIQHRKLTQEVVAFRQQLEAGESLPAKEVMVFLRGWLLDHIVQCDLSYGPYLDSRAGRFAT